MTHHTVVLSVTAYVSESAARKDLEAIARGIEGSDALRYVAAAVLHKGADGAVRIDRGDVVEPGVAWGGALLGAALTVLVAPVGIALLPPVVATPADWAPVNTLVSHFWEQVPQETLRQMTEMLESNPAAIVIVAVDATTADLAALLAKANPMTIVDSTTLGPDATFLRVIDEATEHVRPDSSTCDSRGAGEQPEV